MTSVCTGSALLARAGIDMSLALIAKLHGEEAAEKVAAFAEYEWHRDASWDPFAEMCGLV